MEEPFGPVLPVIRIKSVEEGIRHCNASNFGLQGSVFTRNINKALMISDAMEAGTVQINSAPARGPDHFPFQVLDSGGDFLSPMISPLPTLLPQSLTTRHFQLPSRAHSKTRRCHPRLPILHLQTPDPVSQQAHPPHLATSRSSFQFGGSPKTEKFSEATVKTEFCERAAGL
ncbi:NADP-dependent glyceraldehyde-3-phosphate dehydrogenase [Platanthera guangdongensis]|uniref:NADP-dependent glyceraldehyde-3-phosphate dehydrogenase n=1 Tax=Platanthera guangdongensis TaxID=2320717 RepID=A0ABR2LUT4_9ASPA